MPAAIPIAAAVAGGLASGAMARSGSKAAGTTTTTTDPWGAQQPYLLNGFSNALDWYNNGGTQIAPLNPFQLQSFDMAQQNVNNPALGASNNAITQFANGQMMNNPWLSQMANAADDSITRNYQNAVAPGISSNFEANGRYGSGAMANAQSQSQQDLAHQLGNTNASIYGNAYQQGMNNMLQGAALAPSINSAGLANIGALNSAGNQQQAQQQSVNSQALTNLQNYLNLVGGQMYGNQTTTPYFQNNTAGMLGMAGLGAQIGSNPGVQSAIGGLFSGGGGGGGGFVDTSGSYGGSTGGSGYLFGNSSSGW